MKVPRPPLDIWIETVCPHCQEVQARLHAVDRAIFIFTDRAEGLGATVVFGEERPTTAVGKLACQSCGKEGVSALAAPGRVQRFEDRGYLPRIGLFFDHGEGEHGCTESVD